LTLDLHIVDAGLAVAGSGIGTAVFAPLTHILIRTYSWQGAMLVLGGLTFNCVAFAAVFWPIETQTTRGSSRSSSSQSSLEKVLFLLHLSIYWL
jgi:predicted MFS family arabinose efflux permease